MKKFVIIASVLAAAVTNCNADRVEIEPVNDAAARAANGKVFCDSDASVLFVAKRRERNVAVAVCGNEVAFNDGLIVEATKALEASAKLHRVDELDDELQRGYQLYYGHPLRYGHGYWHSLYYQAARSRVYIVSDDRARDENLTIKAAEEALVEAGFSLYQAE